MRRRFLIPFVLYIFVGQFSNAWELQDLEGRRGIYANFIKRRLISGEDEFIKKAHDFKNDISMFCLNNTKDPLYIMVAQYEKILAPVEKVEGILRHFDNYRKWFDGVVNSSFEVNGKERFLITVEQEVPVPFVSNVRSKMQYAIEKQADQVLFRYELVSSNNLKEYDGFILLSPGPDQTTRITEYDFWVADWGLAKIRGKKSLWLDSLEGMYQTDLAIKYRAESDSLTDQQVLKNSTRDAEHQNFEPCYEQRLMLSL